MEQLDQAETQRRESLQRRDEQLTEDLRLEQDERDRLFERDQDDQARDDRESSARASTLKRKKTKAAGLTTSNSSL